MDIAIIISTTKKRKICITLNTFKYKNSNAINIKNYKFTTCRSRYLLLTMCILNNVQKLQKLNQIYNLNVSFKLEIFFKKIIISSSQNVSTSKYKMSTTSYHLLKKNL